MKLNQRRQYIIKIVFFKLSNFYQTIFFSVFRCARIECTILRVLAPNYSFSDPKSSRKSAELS